MDPKQRPEVSLASFEFELINKAYNDLAALQAAAITCLRSLSIASANIAAVISWARKIPVLRISLDGSSAAASIRQSYSGTRWGISRAWAVSVLALPSPATEYLRGSSRQAVRTNRRHAIAAGLKVLHHDLGADYSRVVVAIHELSVAPAVDPDMIKWLETRAESKDGTFSLLVDSAGKCIGAAHVSSFRQWARLNVSLVAPGPLQSAGRFFLSSEIFMRLAEMGVKNLMMDSALFTKPGLVYYQQRLGFDVRTLAFK